MQKKNWEFGTWMLDAGQIVDDLAPISLLEGDIFYRGYWMAEIYLPPIKGGLRGVFFRDAGYGIRDTG